MFTWKMKTEKTKEESYTLTYVKHNIDISGGYNCQYCINCTTASSVTFFVTGFGLVGIPVTAGVAIGLAMGNELLHEVVFKKVCIYGKTVLESTTNN